MAYRYEKNYAGGQDIVIDGWEKGIAQTPYGGINDLRGVNVADIPGAVFANAKTSNNLSYPLTSTTYLGLSKTFTADAATDRITISGITQEWEYTVVQFTSSGTLPAGLSLSTNYYLRYITTTGVYKVATSLANAIAGTYVDITSAGTGTHTATSTNIGIINATAKDPRSGNIYAIDQNNRVWVNNTAGLGTGTYKWMLLIGNTLTNGAGNGIAVWQNYLFAFRGKAIDVFGPLNDFSTSSWTTDWKTDLNSPTSYTGLHKTFVASNNFLYWTDYTANTSTGRNQGFIGSLNLTGTDPFLPGTSSRFTYTNNALDLPDGEEPVALSELNSQLIIGVNLSGFSSSGTVSKLYSWDTVSASFNNPLIVPESPIYEIVNANNFIYVFCGWRGRVYKTNLAVIDEAFKIPDQLYIPTSSMGYEGLPLSGVVSQATGIQTSAGVISGNNTLYKITFAPQARVTRKKIMFCVNMYGSTALYSYDVKRDLLQIDAKPSNGYGSSSTDSPALYGVEVLDAQATPGTLGTEIIFFGYYYNGSTTTTTIDLYNPITSHSDTNFGSYNGLLTTDIIPVGSTNNPKTLEQLEYILDRDMVSGSGLKIYYRTKIGGTWTLLSTEDYATYGAISSRVIPFSPSGNFVQIKVEFNKYTVLRQLRLR